jgi:DNA-binding transcriptional ArsR family regulator
MADGSDVSGVLDDVPRLPAVGAARGRKADEGAATDERWLRWMARFRFVDARVLRLRFEVSDPAVWVRLRRLTDAGLVTRRRAGNITVFFPSSRALRLLQLPKRKPPRASDRDLAHELAIARWHAELEIAFAAEGDVSTLVLTERDLRERHTAARPYCAFVAGPGGQLQARWPDVALELPGGRLRAYEIELSDKATKRLQAIIAAYSSELRIEHVTYLVRAPALATRLARLVLQERAQAKIAIEPWHEVDDELAQVIARRVEDVLAPTLLPDIAA